LQIREMKKKITFCFVLMFFYVCGWICSQVDGNGYGQEQTRGLGDLANKTATCILDFFNGKYNVKTAIINFENLSGISDLAAQRFYQLLVSKIETATSSNFTFIDLMINFQQDRGVFNLNRIHLLNHLIYIKLTRNKTKIGAGISIFSRTLDKIVFIRYLEAVFTAPEREIYNVNRFGFKAAGFAKIVEMNAKPNLLDTKSFLDQQGKLRFLFYYPEKVEFFRLNKNQLDRFFTYQLEWEKPYYPVRENDGKLSVFFEHSDSGAVLYISVGSNFSKYSKILVFKGVLWEGAGSPGENVKEVNVNFVPFRRIELNNNQYLAGARYVVGKNYFENKLILAPFSLFQSEQPGQLTGRNQEYFEKEVPPFYALDFSIKEDNKILNSIHIIDRDYKYRFLADNFEELTVEEDSRGASLSCLNEQWLATSDFSRGSDKLYFYKIDEGRRQLVFENKINGEIIFISDGLWKGAQGFWVYVKKKKSKQPPADAGYRYEYQYYEYKLQFWSKKSEQKQ
jgi:hypothetical protein